MFNRFRQTAPASVGTPEFIVAGLGNPDRKYTYTRHNSGFLCVDMLADKLGFQVNRLKFKSLIGDAQIGGRRCIVMKPQTYMNNSGEALRECAAFYKIPAENIIIICDDTNLDVGKMRIRRKGSDGGQNGVKSIIYHLNSDNFPRIKIGIGKKPHPQYDLGDWVLSEFTKKDLEALEPVLKNACNALELMVKGETDKAMNQFNN